MRTTETDTVSPQRTHDECSWWDLSSGAIVVLWEDGGHEVFEDRHEAEQRWANMVAMHDESRQEWAERHQGFCAQCQSATLIASDGACDVCGFIPGMRIER
jgi:hypothetical protein